MNLIEKLEKVHTEYENDFRTTGNRFSDAFANGIEQAIDIAKKHSDWVSASERLPETSGKYLVCYSQEYYDGTYFKRFDVVDFYVGINRFDFYHRFITHWQPLPQPPSEVQS